MLFLSSTLSLLLIIICSIVNNLIINFISYVGSAPSFSIGGTISVYNKSTDNLIGVKFFDNLWDCPITWCNIKNKYMNYSGIIIRPEPEMLTSPCTYDITKYIFFKNIYKYKLRDYISITLSLFDIIQSIILDTCIYLTMFRFNNVIMKHIYLLSMILQLISFGVIVSNIINLFPYISGEYYTLTIFNPTKKSIIYIYICLICSMIIFNIFINTIHKYCYIRKKIKESIEECRVLIA